MEEFSCKVNLENIGNFIREERLRRSLSQNEVALLADVTQSTISFLENGTHSTSVQTLIQILKALHYKTEFTFRLSKK